MTTTECHNTGERPALADDLIYGAAAIGKEIGLPTRKVFYHAERGNLPIRKIGNLLVASRRQLRAHLLGEADAA
ncbi:MAG: hypothetical protein ACREE4_01215 [Stellaceae bacterium]